MNVPFSSKTKVKDFTDQTPDVVYRLINRHLLSFRLDAPEFVYPQTKSVYSPSDLDPLMTITTTDPVKKLRMSETE